MVTVLMPFPFEAKVAPACSDTPVPSAVAGAEMTKLFASVMDAMVAPTGMPVPEMAAPTARPAVGAVIVVLPFVVVALRVVPYFPVVELSVLPVMVPKSKVNVVEVPEPIEADWLT